MGSLKLGHLVTAAFMVGSTIALPSASAFQTGESESFAAQPGVQLAQFWRQRD